MRLSQTMERNLDNAGWVTFAMVLGMLSAPHWLAQFATSIFTLVVGLVVAHFVKRELHRRWPHEKRKTDDTE